jgi:hypothetical protein
MKPIKEDLHMNINWNTVKKVSGGIAAVGIIAMMIDYFIAKTKFYKKAAQTMDKTNEYLDKTGKLIEDTMN